MLLPLIGSAHEVITTKLTWTQEISRIVYKHCVSCHREGGSAPMALLTYDETRPWAKAIRDEVAERRMPPWGAVKGFGDFRNDASLSDTEIEMLVLWVEGGAPKGDDVYMPPAPVAREPLKTGMPAHAIRPHGALTRSATIAGIAPRQMQPGAEIQVVARLPDGSIQNLLWLRNHRTEWKRSFYFREPIALPKGTLIVVHPDGAALILAGKPGR
jgi:hypothetical protein